MERALPGGGEEVVHEATAVVGVSRQAVHAVPRLPVLCQTPLRHRAQLPLLQHLMLGLLQPLIRLPHTHTHTHTIVQTGLLNVVSVNTLPGQ